MNAKEVAQATKRILNFPEVDEKIKAAVMNTGIDMGNGMMEPENLKTQYLFSSPVNMNNWDTVTIVRASSLNEAIAQQKTYPQTIDYSVTDDGRDGVEYKINGTFQPWEITVGGSGKNIWFAVRFEDGSFTTDTRTATLPADSEVIISVGLAYFPRPEAQAKNGEYKLSVDTHQDDTAPCVAIMSVDTKGALSVIEESIFKSILSQWFALEETLKLFQPLFATVVIDNGTSEDFTWLHPTYMSYAYRDAPDIGDALFGVLCMTNNRDGSEGIRQLPLISMKQGEDLMFLVNREVFVKYQFLPSLPYAVEGTTRDDYVLGDDGLTVTAEDIKLAPVKYGTATYKPVLHNFMVSFDEVRVRTLLQIDVEISPGIDVHSYVETEHTFAMSYNGNNEPIMIYQNIGEPLVRNEMEVSAGIVVTEVILDIAIAVISAAASEAVKTVLKKVLIAFAAALVVAVVAIIIHVIIEEVVVSGTLEKLPSVTPMVRAGVEPVRWPFAEQSVLALDTIAYSGAFIFTGRMVIE